MVRTARNLHSKERPIIVIGMHRSGTSLVSQLLERSGIPMGIKKTGNAESVFFQKINKDALDFVGVSWRCLQRLPSVAALYSEYPWLVKFMKSHLRQATLLNQHLGWSLGLRMMLGDDKTWGWKDPRNSLTLPLWSHVFPRARVIHVYRDGRDVAMSLGKREAKREGHVFKLDPDRAKTLISDLNLWAEYVDRCEQGMELFEDVQSVKYEALLENPAEQFAEILKGLGFKSQRPIQSIISIVDANRPDSNKRASEDKTWALQSMAGKSMLERLGYLVNEASQENGQSVCLATS